MALAVWLSLFFLAGACVLGALNLVTRGLGLWRDFKAFGRELETTVARVSDAAERLAATSDAASAAPERLQPSLDRLRRSLAQAAVLRAAVQDVQDALGRITAVYPSK